MLQYYSIDLKCMLLYGFGAYMCDCARLMDIVTDKSNACIVITRQRGFLATYEFSFEGIGEDEDGRSGPESSTFRSH